MTDPLFLLAQEIVKRIEAHHYQAYIVGGAVRDALLQRQVDDIDITTSALPQEIQQIFPKVIPTGLQHGTVTVRFQQTSFEVTTFRTEGKYSDFRRPDQVQFVSDLKEDLARRDFTMNAIAIDSSFRPIDPFAGRKDIEANLIRTVGDPNQRFLEDPLRMMRAIRFQSQLGFLIDESALQAISEHRKWLSKIAVERISVEWMKTVTGSHFPRAKQSLVDTRLIDCLPVIGRNAAIQQVMEELDYSYTSIAAFVAYMELQVQTVPFSTWKREWKLSNQIKKDCEILYNSVLAYPANSLSWIIYQVEDRLLTDFQFLCQLYHQQQWSISFLQKQKERLPILTRSELAVNGKDIITLFPDKERGVWIQEMLSAVEKAVVEKQVHNNKNDIREWLQNYGFQ
ncbi:CCA tRNA nucleotidyltransferase [Gracilibacillus caseinilyticus]|uniref:CCA-adding enzyme n=1 Tax=Gracilibacillus caseinilyticus TaxID=2932256 RepID=A0ABY4EUV9_9BACI|nr:CCA tRNA nucleotidyltransferase [Gracilibacillus caseinilyticus]UOQ47597.1 CCA tRNA nucleotidyltransferase [Gracilibacillus caseinilyticus]